jgi:hypothetical protein
VVNWELFTSNVRHLVDAGLSLLIVCLFVDFKPLDINQSSEFGKALTIEGEYGTIILRNEK